MKKCTFICWMCQTLHIHRSVWQVKRVLYIAARVCVNFQGKLKQRDPPYENGSWINVTETRS